MKLFGLTGGIGMGKSTSASLLAKRGIAVIDTDLVARELVEPGQPALAEIAEAFGRELIDSTGKLRRSALAEIVFASPEKLKQLETILHPRILEKWLAQAGQWRGKGREAAVVVIPLLFETDAQSHFDAILCTACSAPTQQDRLRARGWSPEQIHQRIGAQWPIEKKIAASNYVIWTEGDLALHERQIDIIMDRHFTSRR